MSRARVPSVTAEQMREVDRLAVEAYGIGLPPMMENAGRLLAGLARRRFLRGVAGGRRVVVLAGTGGNGGGALVGARRLHAWGCEVQVLLPERPERLAPVTRRQLATLERMRIPVVAPADRLPADRLPVADLVVDGLVGYGLKGPLRGAVAELVRSANECGAPIVALDVPSGVHATTGRVFDPAIRATATLTLALPKSGLGSPSAADRAGELYLADIGIPPALYREPTLGLEVGPLFARRDILRLRSPRRPPAESS